MDYSTQIVHSFIISNLKDFNTRIHIQSSEYIFLFSKRVLPFCPKWIWLGKHESKGKWKIRLLEPITAHRSKYPKSDHTGLLVSIKRADEVGTRIFIQVPNARTQVTFCVWNFIFVSKTGRHYEYWFDGWLALEMKKHVLYNIIIQNTYRISFIPKWIFRSRNRLLRIFSKRNVISQFNNKIWFIKYLSSSRNHLSPIQVHKWDLLRLYLEWIYISQITLHTIRWRDGIAGSGTISPTPSTVNLHRTPS